MPVAIHQNFFNTGKKGETNITEVVYEEAEDYLEPGKSTDDGGRGIMVQKCPAY